MLSSHVSLFVTPGTVACQAPLSMEFSRKEYWSGLPFPSPRDLPDPGLNMGLLHCRQILYHLSWATREAPSRAYFRAIQPSTRLPQVCLASPPLLSTLLQPGHRPQLITQQMVIEDQQGQIPGFYASPPAWDFAPQILQLQWLCSIFQQILKHYFGLSKCFQWKSWYKNTHYQAMCGNASNHSLLRNLFGCLSYCQIPLLLAKA